MSSADEAAYASPIRPGVGRNAPRSKNGCYTCRKKKVKCGEERPQCARCIRLKLLCDYNPRKRKSKKMAKQALELIQRPKSRRYGPELADSDDAPADPDIWMDSWSRAILLGQGSRCPSAIRMSSPMTGACSLDLTALDHESIRYFRTSFAKLHHTKNPDYSLFSIMFSIAQVDPMVMHMLLALGGREIEFRRNRRAEEDRGPWTPLSHYSCALRMLAEAINTNDTERLDLDSLHTVIYLMLLYEQKYGDEKCSGVSNHLMGASQILVSRHKKLQLPAPSLSNRPTASSALIRRTHTAESCEHLSLYSARLLVWIALYDGAAASFRLGGQLNASLYSLMSDDDEPQGFINPFQPLEQFDRLHRFSNPLYRVMWGDDYPQNELVDDIENRNVFSLLTHCSQLRCMVAELDKADRNDDTEFRRRAAGVELCIHSVWSKFVELMEVAGELSVQTDNSHRLVANLRSIVPFYWAVVLDFLRTTEASTGTSLSTRQRDALREIMNLAFQAYKHEGDEAMMRIAWPLFMVALETDDLVHRDWVLERFDSISQFGKNFERAYQFLRDITQRQTHLEMRVDLRGRLQSGEVGLFVI
ncbi:unnamed protein product [Clonostachys rosea]|uniref:Zn(2)-C6 fungal-type domain-containing protein n=1 Tax=Bionectria ochroleuca TaxID=29856 RepID=A0ABY6V2X3_BIOOC|nr:unnamed protein product [Clonostachys rosea]